MADDAKVTAETAAAAPPAGAPAAERTGARHIPLPLGLTPFALGLAAILVVAFVIFRIARPAALAFDDAALRNIGDVIAPLVVVAAFIERAVEVIMTPTRGDAADRLRSEIAGCRSESPQGDVRALERSLHEHQLGSRRRAFMLAVALGVLASLLGLRGLESLLAADAAPGAGFQFFDIVVTGLVVGGGADGIHTIVEAMTDYLEMVSRQSQKKE